MNDSTPTHQPEASADLHGWKITAACQAVDFRGDIVEGVWELGHRDEDGNFYAIATVDTGNYDQPEAAEPLARAILARLAIQPPAAPAQVGTSGASAEVSSLAEEHPDDLLTVAHIESEDGAGTLTLEFGQLGDLASLVGEDEATYTVRVAGMKRSEFEALGEFDGF